MSTQKEKKNSKRPIVRSAMRRRTLLASQNVLFIDEVNKMLYPIGFDDFPFEAEPPAMFEPSEKMDEISNISVSEFYKVKPPVMFEPSEKEVA